MSIDLKLCVCGHPEASHSSGWAEDGEYGRGVGGCLVGWSTDKPCPCKQYEPA